MMQSAYGLYRPLTEGGAFNTSQLGMHSGGGYIDDGSGGSGGADSAVVDQVRIGALWDPLTHASLDAPEQGYGSLLDMGALPFKNLLFGEDGGNNDPASFRSFLDPVKGHVQREAVTAMRAALTDPRLYQWQEVMSRIIAKYAFRVPGERLCITDDPHIEGECGWCVR